jgi:hypothetical protein
MEAAPALEKATVSELVAFEVQCPLRGEHVVVPSDPVLVELEAFPSKLIRPVCLFAGLSCTTTDGAHCHTQDLQMPSAQRSDY